MLDSPSFRIGECEILSQAGYLAEVGSQLCSTKMYPLADQILWLLTTLVEAFVVCIFVAQGLFRKFLFLNSYLLLSVALGIGWWLKTFDLRWGFIEYFCFSWFSYALLSFLFFLAICELSVRLLGTRMPLRKVLSLGLGTLLAVALLSLVADPFGPILGPPAVSALPVGIFFACWVTVVLLWAWKVRNDPENRIAGRLVAVLGVYLSLVLLSYGLFQIAPLVSSSNDLPAMAAAWLPLGCGFALLSR